MIATVGGMEQPYGDGAVLDIESIASCCCMVAITTLNSAMMSLLHCTVALLEILKA